MLAGGMLFWPRISLRQQERVARRLVEKLAERQGLDPLATLQEVAELGDASIEALVQAASAEQAATALVARRTIDEQFATWQHRGALELQFPLGKKLGLLARALAKHAPEFGPFGQRWASGLALEMIDLSADLPPEQTAALLADCSTVLTEIPATGDRKRAPHRSVSGQNHAEALPPLQPDLHVLAIPSEHAISGPLPTDDLASNQGSAEPLTRRRQEGAGVVDSRRPVWVPEWQGSCSPEFDTQVTPPTSLVESHEKTPAPPAESSPIVEVPSPAQMDTRIEALRSLSTRQLFENLQDADFYELGMLSVVLGERGFGERELELGVLLISPNPESRLTLIDALSTVPAQTARRWLRELLRDADADVRVKALTAMATTQDPSLVQIARELAAQDSDPRVVQLATRIVNESR